MKKLSYISLLFITCFLCTGTVFASCPLGPDVTKDLYGVLKVIRIAAPLLVIVFTIFESIQALTKGDVAADMKKVATRFGKRCIYAVLLFFIPILIDQFMQMADIWGVGGTCDINNPESNEVEEGTTESTTTTTTTTTAQSEENSNSNNHYDIPGFSCSNFIDKTSCEASGCDFYGGACYEKSTSSEQNNSSDTNNHYDIPGFSCSNFVDDTSCSASGCNWVGGACYPYD